MPIYTHTGDDGTTSLFGGKRILKNHVLVEAYGFFDELNAYIGFLISAMTILPVQEFLRSIQKDLFVIGSVFAGKDIDMHPLHQRVQEMEDRMDAMEKDIKELHEFILPGGSQLGSMVHITRAVARRVERYIVSLLTFPTLEKHVTRDHVQSSIQYMNRLSDFLFILARFINKQEDAREVTWSKLHKK